MSNDAEIQLREEAKVACMQALKRVCLSLPHLTGLVHKVRIQMEERIGTAGVFASGRMVVNPHFALSLRPDELTFVLAHEVLHLALDTHRRGTGSPPEAVNVAHDYIINDILSQELGLEVPAGGLAYSGARRHSLEDLLSKGVRWHGNACWQAVKAKSQLTSMGEALVDAGLVERPETEKPDPVILDVLAASMEREWYPDEDAKEIEQRTSSIREAAAKAKSLQVIKDEMDRTISRAGGSDAGEWVETVEALKTNYRPPWQLALQRWFDAQAPGERSFARPSRRASLYPDIVMPGRKREGHTMHIVLDTSGSMIEDLRLLLGIIASFCENSGISEVHMLQCDVGVTVDEWITPEELELYEIRGFGGSDMSPVMHHLAEDPGVESAIVITDGFIDYPQEAMPYHVLWAVIDIWDYDFEPPYGITVKIPIESLH